MPRVLLINTNTLRVPYPVPPLGLCLLAAHLGVQYETKIWDGTFAGAVGLSEFVKSWKPDYIGFGIRNVDDTVMDKPEYYVPDILHHFIQPVKKVTGVPIILGGSGFSIFPGPLMELTGADFGVVGEGEEVLFHLLQRLDRGENPAGTPNLFTRASKGQPPHLHTSLLDPALLNLSEIDLKIDFSLYRERGAYSVQTKRGCRRECIYCTYPTLEGCAYRLRDPLNIAEEIERLYQRVGTVMVEFVDSVFNEPEGFAEAICRAVIRRKVPMKFRTMGINPAHTSRELLELMKQAGFVQVDVTPDSASPAVIRNLKKGFRMEDIIRTASLLKEVDLPAMWFFLFGGPGESEDTVHETLRFIEEHVHPEDMAWLTAGLRIYPGTPLHTTALREGKVLPGDDLLYPPVFYVSEQVSAVRLRELIREASGRIPQCVPATESTPSQALLAEAVTLRSALKLQEPMFRTLMRLRRKKLTSEGLPGAQTGIPPQ